MKPVTVTTVAAMLVIALLFPGCGSEPPSLESAGGAITPSAGCGTEPPIAPGESAAFSMRVDNLAREYLLHLPPTYDADDPIPLVLDFHGYTGTAAGEEAYTGLSRHADEHGYMVVYPQGTGFTVDSVDLVTSWNDLAGSVSAGPDGPICSDTADEYPHPPECGEPKPCVWATCHDDLGFIDTLLDRLDAKLCVNLDRIYATGMSNGGMFVHRLGCEMADRFAAIAPVGGTLARGLSCAPDTPLAMLNIYGSSDDHVSQLGDTSSDGYFYESAKVVIGKWAGSGSQQCDKATSAYETSLDGVLGLSCIQHDNCATGAEVVHCTWYGEHDWPQAEGQPVGNDIIWEFFSKHTRAKYRAAQESEALPP